MLSEGHLDVSVDRVDLPQFVKGNLACNFRSPEQASVLYLPALKEGNLLRTNAKEVHAPMYTRASTISLEGGHAMVSFPELTSAKVVHIANHAEVVKLPKLERCDSFENRGSISMLDMGDIPQFDGNFSCQGTVGSIHAPLLQTITGHAVLSGLKGSIREHLPQLREIGSKVPILFGGMNEEPVLI